MRSHRAVGVHKVVRTNQKQSLFSKMGYYCTVPQCTSLAGKTKNVKFHRFPRDEHQAEKWNDILKRGKPYTKYSKVCSLHFTQSDYNVTAMGKGQWKTLSKEALPSQNLPRLKADGTPLVIRKSRTVKYRDVQVKKEIDAASNGEIVEEKWRHGASTGTSVPSVATLPAASVASVSSVGCSTATQDGVHSPLHDAVAYRLHSQLSQLSQHSHSQQSHSQSEERPHKQDAIMQTDPLSEDEQLLSNTFSDHSESSFHSDTHSHTHTPTHAAPHTHAPAHTQARDYSKSPTEEYKYKQYQQEVYQTHSPAPAQAQNYQQVEAKIEYQPRPDSQGYPYGYGSCADTHTHTQAHTHAQAHTHTHSLLLQEQMYQQHKYEEETRVKQEVDEYERGADIGADVSATSAYSERARLQERLQLMVKSEPDPLTGCEQLLAPASPYFQTNGQLAGGYYTQYSRQAPTVTVTASSNSIMSGSTASAPGAELLIAKQNALAAHTQLWQNTMKRPFFYSDSAQYATSAGAGATQQTASAGAGAGAGSALHRYEV